MLRTILNEEIYFSIFYFITEVNMFYSFLLCDNGDENIVDNFCKLFNNLLTIKEQLLNDNNVEIFEKIIVILNYLCLFLSLKSVQSLEKTEFLYVIIELFEENSIIAMNFLKEFIEVLNEDSPSFFKLIEINSNFGYYKDEKKFTFEMINLFDLKNHLKEILPSIICFYCQNSIDIHVFMNRTTTGVTINKN